MEELVGFCDADFAGDPQSRKAEYIVAAEYTKELMYLKAVLVEILGKEVTARLHVDNQSALSVMKNGVLNRRSKHIDVRYHYIHEKVSESLVKVNYYSRDRQKADTLMKPLPSVKFKTHLSEIVR
ncbi:hypothetical protein PR048_004944 [Dryococelus australis]|uniref:Polyprotein n=1 Tax=Dryococelus australis TaxID=614101 RepID=A0ABQ9I6V1_9NEOP|nr:hypothetical protein PR048_004944 [Dryococelus australis]